MKRLTDATKFDKTWYRKLPLEYKVLWELILAKCSDAGTWTFDADYCEFVTGVRFDENEALATFGREHVELLLNGKWRIVGFVQFQSGDTNWSMRTARADAISDGFVIPPGPRGDGNKAIEEAAETIYKHYPRRVGKRKALTSIEAAIRRLGGTDDAIEWLDERTRAYARSPAGKKPPEGRNDYRPHPTTWFNQERYNDPEGEWDRPNGVDRNGPTTRIHPDEGKYAKLSIFE